MTLETLIKQLDSGNDFSVDWHKTMIRILVDRLHQADEILQDVSQRCFPMDSKEKRLNYYDIKGYLDRWNKQRENKAA